MFFFSVRLNLKQLDFSEPIFRNSFLVWVQFVVLPLSPSLFRSPFLSGPSFRVLVLVVLDRAEYMKTL